MSRPAKVPRLRDVVGLSSNTSIHAVYKILKRLPIGGGRDKLYDANQEVFNALRIREPLELEDGSNFDWDLASPSRLLQYMVSVSRELQEVYARSANANSCSIDRKWQRQQHQISNGISKDSENHKKQRSQPFGVFVFLLRTPHPHDNMRKVGRMHEVWNPICM